MLLKRIFFVSIFSFLLATPSFAGFWSDLGQFVTGGTDNQVSGGGVENYEYFEGSEFYELGKSSDFAHDFDGLCEECHGNEPSTKAEAGLLPGASDLCVDCHGQFKRDSHPVDIGASMTVPEDMPTPDGKVSCVTCHNPCSAEINRSFKLLRVGSDPDTSFCQRCHEDWGGDGHAGSIGVAHPLRETPAKSHGEIDAMSKNCIACHDGINAPKAMYNRHGDGTVMINYASNQGSHKIGAVYEYMATDDEWINKNSLDERISLYEGKMGCLSCHNPYTRGANHLTVEISGSKLCLSCHNK